MKCFSGDAKRTFSRITFITSCWWWTASPVRGSMFVCKMQFCNPISITAFSSMRCTTILHPFTYFEVTFEEIITEAAWVDNFWKGVHCCVSRFKSNRRFYVCKIEDGKWRKDFGCFSRLISTGRWIRKWVTDGFYVLWAHCRLLIRKKATKGRISNWRELYYKWGRSLSRDVAASYGVVTKEVHGGRAKRAFFYLTFKYVEIICAVDMF